MDFLSKTFGVIRLTVSHKYIVGHTLHIIGQPLENVSSKLGIYAII